MNLEKIFLTILVTFLISINANAETITFPAGIYEGEVDSKGRADGKGIFKFKQTQWTYEGNFSKNKIHNEGRFLDDKGKLIYQGKNRYGRVMIYLEDKTIRKNVIAKLETGIESKFEMKENNKWYEAEEVNGAYQLTSQGQMALEKDKEGAGGGGSSGGGCGG